MPKDTEKQIQETEEELQKLKRIETLEKEIEEAKAKKSKPKASDDNTPSDVIIPKPSQSKKLKGIGGWLILVAIALFIIPLGLIYGGSVNINSEASGISYLDTLVIFETIIIFALGFYAIHVLVIFLEKKKEFPERFTYFVLGWLAFVFLDLILFSGYSGPGASEGIETGFQNVLIVSIYAGIGISYVRKSVRVKNTFIE